MPVLPSAASLPANASASGTSSRRDDPNTLVAPGCAWPKLNTFTAQFNVVFMLGGGGTPGKTAQSPVVELVGSHNRNVPFRSRTSMAKLSGALPCVPERGNTFGNGAMAGAAGRSV